MVGAEGAHWWYFGIIILGTRDRGGKEIFGEELEDFEGDLSGLLIENETGVFDVLETEGRKVLAAAVLVSAAAIAVVVRGNNGCPFLLSACVGKGRGKDLGNGISNEDSLLVFRRSGGRCPRSSSSLRILSSGDSSSSALERTWKGVQSDGRRRVGRTPGEAKEVKVIVVVGITINTGGGPTMWECDG